MIDSYDIIQFIAVSDPSDPPFVSRLFVILPVIQRIPPQLTLCGKSIGRQAIGRYFEALPGRLGIRVVRFSAVGNPFSSNWNSSGDAHVSALSNAT